MHFQGSDGTSTDGGWLDSVRQGWRTSPEKVTGKVAGGEGFLTAIWLIGKLYEMRKSKYVVVVDAFSLWSGLGDAFSGYKELFGLAWTFRESWGRKGKNLGHLHPCACFGLFGNKGTKGLLMMLNG
ncbi:hypothetical protein CK203_066802 [Vitis vinifera]|uniref:Uncharacterized protein n=1 Tax=Vitis vinifera TaxID=29760 RepID=A0A438EVH5_VITVI|nr:hypothetical protein CK203_066802 [Vitis vinifera]